MPPEEKGTKTLATETAFGGKPSTPVGVNQQFLTATIRNTAFMKTTSYHELHEANSLLTQRTLTLKMLLTLGSAFSAVALPNPSLRFVGHAKTLVTCRLLCRRFSRGLGDLRPR